MLRRYLVIIITTITAIGLSLLRAFSLGKQQEQAKQNKAALDASINRQEIEDEINKSDDANIRADLSSWVRKHQE